MRGCWTFIYIFKLRNSHPSNWLYNDVCITLYYIGQCSHCQSIVKEMAYKIPGWCFLEIIHEKWAILACWNTIKCTAQKIKMKIFISKEALIYISYNLPKNTPNIFFMLHHSMIFDRKTKGNPKSLTLSLCSIAILTKSLFFHRHFLLPILPYFNHFLLPYSRELLSLKI